jgi:hypothetical protein
MVNLLRDLELVKKRVAGKEHTRKVCGSAMVERRLGRYKSGKALERGLRNQSSVYDRARDLSGGMLEGPFTDRNGLP